MAFTAQALMTASSRMSYAFARDRGLPFSRIFAIMHRSGVPVNSVLLTTACVVVFGCIYLGSDTALNAILSSSVVFLNISYSIPSALLQTYSGLIVILVIQLTRRSPACRYPWTTRPATTLPT